MNALLLLLLDSRAPAGAQHHSGGMEPATEIAMVRNVEQVAQFCRGRLRTSARVSAAFAAAACHAWQGSRDAMQWELLEAELTARLPSAASRVASRQMGNGLGRLVRTMVPECDFGRLWRAVAPLSPHHSVVLGAAVALAGGDALLAARAAALGSCTAPASAAVRLLGLDPFAVHGMLAELTDDIDEVAAECAAMCSPGRYSGPRSLPSDSAPALDLLADFHVTTEVRLFAS
ncbi:MAG: urease accessory protein UreF [Actinomycetota bacterium]|nr:urease accessory protein UreF [Actinomycetota bacterium]